MNESKAKAFLAKEKMRLEEVLDQLTESDKKIQMQAVQNAAHRKELMARVNQIDACLEDDDE